jgi:2-polyprenyl-3-methyl-5-hydroxy-6-metoxy-1,4-benzoquinol methylase
MDNASWDRRYGGRELVWSAEPNRFLVAETETLAPGQAIDLACGEGRNAIWLAEREWEVVGVDFSEVGLRKARELADARGVNVDWVAGDLLDYRPEPQAFDLVLVFYLQVPAAQRRPILQAAAEAIAPTARSCSSRTTAPTSSTGTAARSSRRCCTPRTTSSTTSTAPGSRSSAPTASSGRCRHPTETAWRWTRSCAPAAPTDTDRE